MQVQSRQPLAFGVGIAEKVQEKVADRVGGVSAIVQNVVQCLESSRALIDSIGLNQAKERLAWYIENADRVFGWLW